MELLSECPICMGKEFTQFLKCKDFTVSHETFQLIKCNSCDLVFTNPRPNSEEISRYYESEDYISHSNSSKGLFNILYQKVRNIAVKGKVKLIRSLHSTERRILDYGSGTGEFLNEMKSEGWGCKGIEPSGLAREMSISNYHLDVTKPDSLSKFNDKEFGVITLWHVLEHIHQLKETVDLLNRSLVKGGFLIIAVPNREAWDAEYYSYNWAAYDVPRHLYHFTIKNIISLFAYNDLNIISIHPMPFDPFYIDLLSEKYRSGKFNYINAFLNGIKTTIAGRRNIAKNSSLIYIFQKKL